MTAAATKLAAVEITARITSLVWAAEDASYAIVKVRVQGGPDDGREIVAKGQTDPDAGLPLQCTFRFAGEWHNHERHGRQFQFASYAKIVPHDKRGVIAYLASTVDGVGERTAYKLWDAFGADAVRVLREDTARVVASGVLGEERAKAAALDLHNEAAFEAVKVDLLALFAGRGFQAAKLIRACIQAWGERAPERVRRNPYALMIRGMVSAGFKRCDKLYLDRGGKPDRLKRQMLCAWYALRQDASGHTWHRLAFAGEAVEAAMPLGKAKSDRAIRLGVRSGWLSIRETDGDERMISRKWVAERGKAKNEEAVAREVLRLARGEGPIMTPHWPDPAELRDDLSDHQRGRLGEILCGPLAAPIALLTGTPGTGKTFCVGAIVDALARNYGESSLAVCAPTGKAAVRITQAVRRVSRAKVTAKTIHTLFEIGKNGHATGGDWGFQRNRDKPLDERFVIVDEASMLDTDLSASLLSACATGTHVLLVGDPYQLPPVGHGAPLRDLIAAGVPCAELTEIRRNAGMIVHACAAIKDNREWEIAERFDPEAGMNLRHLEAATPAAVAKTLEAVLGQFKSSAKFDPTWGVQVLCGTNKTRKVLNKQLQTLLNPVADGQGVRHKHPFRKDDKIICLRNHWAEGEYPYKGQTYYLANGEIGRVVAAEEKYMHVDFAAGRPMLRVPIGKVHGADDEDGEGQADGGEQGGGSGAGCHMDLAYCVTGHKMQGSESPCVIVVIEEGPGVGRVCSKEWLYTALSRASQLCITVGREGVMRQMARRESLTKRKTFLRELLTNG